MTSDEAVQHARMIIEDRWSYDVNVTTAEALKFLLDENMALKQTLAEHVHCQECNAIISLRGVFVALYPENKPPYFCTFECSEKYLEKSPEAREIQVRCDRPWPPPRFKFAVTEHSHGDESRPITESESINPS